MSTLFSMTGYAQARRDRDGTSVAVTLKAVNHRFLDLRWQAPPELEGAIPPLEKRLRAEVARGHVDIRIGCEGGERARGPRLDEAWVEAYLRAHADLSRRLGRPEPPAVADLLRLSGAWSTPSSSAGNFDAAAALALLPEAFAAALEELNRMRRAEGAALGLDLVRRLERIAAARLEIAGCRQALEAALLDRLRRRIEELMGAAAPSSDRLLQEAALLAERADISEELTRIEAHLGQFRATLAAGGEAGKKLDFLTQEMNREVNTLLSKSSAAAPPGLRIAEIGLALKAEVEKIREQVQNLE